MTRKLQGRESSLRSFAKLTQHKDCAMTGKDVPRAWTDSAEIDGVKRKFLKCECSQNTENLFYVYEQKPGRVNKRGLFAHCPKCNGQIRLRLGYPR